MNKPLLSLLLLATAAITHAAPLQLQSGDRIIFVGNTFAERLNDAGYFETLLTSRFPEHKLVFRNMAWSGDTVIGVVSEKEVEQNLRPLNFGDQMTHLHEQKPDVIFACYGMMESFDGPDGLPRFEEALMKWLSSQLSMSYRGKGAPRVVLVSPIAHEALGGKMPDPTAHNEQLAAYTAAMKKVADAHAGKGVSFLDLFTPTRQLMAGAGAQKLTINGIHLNDHGNALVAQAMMQGLGLSVSPEKIEVDSGGTLPVRVKVTQTTLPAPTVAGTERPPEDMLQHGQLVVVRGLPVGEYTLSAGGRAVANGSAADWARGVRVTSSPAQAQADKLLAAIEDKNLWFFHRYRPVNGEYIFGRRAKPFGVVNFPAEMEKLDQFVSEKDAQIWELSRPSSAETFELQATPLR